MQVTGSRQEAKPLIFHDFEKFEKVTGILWQLKHIRELKYLNLTLSPDTDGSYRPSKAVLGYLRKFCRDNPGYHIVTETTRSNEIAKSFGVEAHNWLVRTFVNCATPCHIARRYYLADGDGGLSCELIEMIALAPTNVVPFRRN